MNYKLVNNITAWLVFLVASFVYISTIEPTASLWDCGEFIATAFKLEVGHPPGAPLFMIMARVASLFAGNDVTQVAKMVNTMSALSSSFTILFLFWTITHFAKKFVAKGEEMSLGNIIAIMGSGVVGALAYTFSDSFWFSAVEGEVYAMSSLFTAIVFWAILKWEDEADQEFSNRWVILIAYLIGLSVGVHLLNLLAIPAIVFVYYFRNYKPETKGIIGASIISLMLLVVIMYGIIPGVVTMASKFELMFVNGMGLPFNTGIFIFVLLMLTSVIATLYYTSRENTNHTLKSILFAVSTFLLGTTMFLGNVFMAILLSLGVFALVYMKGRNYTVVLNNIVLAATVIMIGYSSFSMIVIRSFANPPLDENNPENVFALLSYLNREQYGDRPLFYGQYFNAPSIDVVQTKPVYIESKTKDGKDQYIIADHKQEAVYDSRYTTIFPRMYDSQEHHIKGYMGYVGMKEGDLYNPLLDKDGEIVRNKKTGKVRYNRRSPKNPPSFGQNLKYFFNYQVGFMYLRYFAWNFIGRQNDMQGHGEINKGNWISGIPGMGMETNYDKMPKSLLDNKARNMYYFLPLLLGLVGLYFQFKRGNNGFWIVMLLFILTGLAIVVYLNQYPYQPRERDYAYVGSFYAFAIWIGLGVFGLYELISKKIPKKIGSVIAVVATFLLVPSIMASNNWDDHDRSNRYTARDIAKNYLMSCEPNAILFTNGDNDTFPLWYVQEVEGFRTDVRVVNLSLLNTDWYIDQMKRKAYDSDPVPFSLTHDQYVETKRAYMPVNVDNENYYPINQIVFHVKSDDISTKTESTTHEMIDFVYSNKFTFDVPIDKLIKNGTIKAADTNKVVKTMHWKYPKRGMPKADFMILDLLVTNNWERPIYFAMTVGNDGYAGLQKYFQLDGMAYRLVPIESGGQRGSEGRVDTDILYNKLMNEFVYGNIGDDNVYLDEQNMRMTMNLRGGFTRITQQLMIEGDTARAKKALDKSLEVIPKEKVPLDFYGLSMSESYYRLNEPEKARDIILSINTNKMEELNWYSSLPSDERKTVSDKIERAKGLIAYLYGIASSNKDEIAIKQLKETGAEEIYNMMYGPRR